MGAMAFASVTALLEAVYDAVSLSEETTCKSSPLDTRCDRLSARLPAIHSAQLSFCM